MPKEVNIVNEHTISFKTDTKFLWIICPEDDCKHIFRGLIYTRAPVITCPVCGKSMETGFVNRSSGGCGC